MRPQRVWDDMSGRKLSPDMVAKAREEELEELRKHSVREGAHCKDLASHRKVTHRCEMGRNQQRR